jgi:flavorubredoxin
MNKITDDILYIGTDDLNIDLFESQYDVPEGMSYNSFLILDEKIAVMDTTERQTAEKWKDNLRETLNGKKPDYLIVHHMEPDHAALIADMLQDYPGLTIVASAAAIKMIPQFFDGISLENRTLPVKEGDTLSLGQHTLQFIMAPMVHWPEVMVTYDSKDKVLFSADGFGKFGALSKTGGLFCTAETDWACEARRYYFNICGKYGVQVKSLLRKASQLDIQTICPLHGPILRETLATQMSLYDTWSSYGVETPGIFIAHASIHGGTAKAAERLAEILREKGCPKVVVSDLCRSDLGENIEDAFRYGTMVVCASSYDGTVFPPMHDFLWHLQIKNYQKRRIGIVENGSWAPCAARVMKDMFAQMKNIEIIDPQVTIRSTLKLADELALTTLTEQLMKP